MLSLSVVLTDFVVFDFVLSGVAVLLCTVSRVTFAHLDSKHSW